MRQISWLTAITARVSALRTQLRGWRAAGPCCSTLQRAGCASSRLASQPANRTLGCVQLPFPE
ncbi:hypothetical protein [Denitromonas halophila]|uniref:Uncharacterized protein n=1 Tax=Denitromonas halophila TaxID=1629404 RepID=A0A557QHB6_9RHOO|nr:hypothetical protein [Denitromonas halophila]TVO52292.1 hypothetical protein FHP91_17850 [Denitromonas halophila]